MSLGDYLEMELVELTEDFATVRMPVNEKTRQPFGFLHGGASVALAEQTASIAATKHVSAEEIVFGLEINANHISSVQDGYVLATATPIHIGRTTHVWQVEVRSEEAEDRLLCISRCTLAVKLKR
ncbi:1,4-dihydroxy-2-naphthoyl-CoA hydrolase MenI [Listeria grandensis]|uniref:PaaI family thioesterase n=1 Tax=Listeria grandensis TaxID=1494963 RepID=A0A7X0Y4V0_9LIST|nr:PaaI family thioesterase [Listeria grandensis]MBC1936944.1 PaaI family thioesterase [Listeria grandensis]MBC6316581.1 PaaI family thioesterase [Listeria grandensis]